MNTIFLSYNENYKQKVNEITSFIKEQGGCYDFVFDSDVDATKSGNIAIWSDNIQSKLADIDGMILLLGNDTHSPRKSLEEELGYIVKFNLPVFGVKLPEIEGKPPDKIKDYMRYFELPYDLNQILKQIQKELPC